MPLLTARRFVLVLAGLTLALALAIALCASVGSSGYTLFDLLRPDPGPAADMIVRVRLPRVLIAVLAGAALAAA